MVSDRAVSEVVGFILVFSLVLGTITVVYVGGFAELEDTRIHEQNTNAERAFDVLADNFEEIGRDKAPSRATEIKLSGSGVRVADNRNRRSQITANGSRAAAQSRPIVYESGEGTRIVYESGAVFRQEREGAVMIREPDFVFDEHRTVVRYIEARGGEQSISGSKTVLVRAERTHSRLLLSEMNATGVDVEFNVTTDGGRAESWQRYLEGELEGLNRDCEQIPDTDSDAVVVSCAFETESIHVARTRLVVRLA